MALRIIFMGTPEFSVPTLKALHQAGHEIVACYTQPPRPAGRRGLELVKSPVHLAAEELGIDVFTPQNFKEPADLNDFAEHKADVGVVVAYGLLLPEGVLAAPNFGCFNGHASLLPRWRGAAPIQRAIMAGDDQTGIMIMKMEAGLDTGPVAMTASVKIDASTTAGALHDQLALVGADLMVEAMADLEAGSLKLEPQDDEGVVYASKISKQETRIDWAKSARDVQKHIMGLSPFPGAWCEMPLGGKVHRVKILSATVVEGEGSAGEVLSDDLILACGEGAVQLNTLQKAGSKIMEQDVFLTGNSLPVGTVLI